MAIVWGPWVGPDGPSGSRRMRLGIELDTTTETVSAATLRRRVYYETGTRVIDNYAAVSGTGPGSWAFSVGTGTYGDYDNSGSETRLLRTDTVSVSKTYGSAQSVSTSVSLSGIDYIPGTASVSGSIGVAARPYATPSAPTATSAARTGDTTARVSITHGPVGLSTPIATTLIERSVDGGVWSQVVSLSGAATSWTDTGISLTASYRYRARTQNSAAVSPYGPISGVVVARPANLAGVTAARVSDTQVQVTITHAATDPNAPVTSTVIERSTDGAAYAVVVRLSGAATSWTNTGVSADHRYVYRARAQNSAGYSAGYRWTPYVYTTPAAPAAVAATRTASNDIEVVWTNRARWGASVDVDRAANGTWGSRTWSAVPTTGLTDAAPLTSATYAYRVRAVTPDGLRGEWSVASATVQLLTAPAAPTGLSGGAFDATEPSVWSWTHNPRDTTAQTARQTQWRYQGVTGWTAGTQTSTTQPSVTIPAGMFTNGRVVEWQVRTRGAAAEWSPWSATQVYVTSARPSMGFTAPNEVRSGVVRAEWTYSDAEGGNQAGWRARLLVDGSVVESRSGTSATTRTTTFTHTVADGSLVVVEGEVADPDGMWSATAQSDSVVVAYDLPEAPVVEVTYDVESGAAAIQITNPTGDPMALHNRVIADDGEGGWRLVADQVPPNGAVVDTTPVLGAPTTYRVEAVSALPSTAVTETVVTHDPDSRFWLTTPTGEAVWVADNPDLQIETGTETTEVRYVGRRYPVIHANDTGSEQWRLTATILPAPTVPVEATLRALRNLANAPLPIVCLRSPVGQRVWGVLHPISTTTGSIHAANVTITLTRTGSHDDQP